MANTYKVTVGSNAYSFHDQATGITICKGEVKELTSRQYSSKRVRMALSSGHLVLVPEETSKVSKYSTKDIENLQKKLKAQFNKGAEVAKVAKGYSLEEITLVAKEHGFEVDAEDTVETLVTALFEEFEEEKGK